MRIGVFGGSFDPVHSGHLAAARGVANRLKLDQVRFLPAGLQPFKGAHRATATERAEMLEAALRGSAAFVVDRRELGRPGPSYMIDTLCALKADFPRDQLFLMLGADAAADLPAWREADRIPTLATLVVHTRPGAPVPALPWPVERVDLALPDVSATVIRERVASDQPIDTMVPDAVRTYIAAHGLYETEGAC